MGQLLNLNPEPGTRTRWGTSVMCRMMGVYELGLLIGGCKTVEDALCDDDIQGSRTGPPSPSMEFPMHDFDAVLAHRNGERVGYRKPRKCDECGRVREDVYTTEATDSFSICTECEARDDMAHHKAAGHAVVGLVKFDGKQTGTLPHGWYIDYAYGSLLADGRILEGLPGREVKPESFETI